ncbi:hypothetical protein EVAR_21228_1 [Eumeta japonica]|uniref:Reverse transcriptase domain-containing protein n=1 Tax=Eumeta variegata TaxID=151549 RepID=A0A4C1UQ52_EUMVA|nr:hypothetical protein EVAR_21228_1 [Eumeta japonica]
MIRARVSQGTTFSPLLYSAYTNDILHPKTCVQVALFTEDITLFLERFFSIEVNHPDPLISVAASYESPPKSHFIKRPRNALLDSPDDFTAKRKWGDGKESGPLELSLSRRKAAKSRPYPVRRGFLVERAHAVVPKETSAVDINSQSRHNCAGLLT